jgi:hypothetical protein
MMPTPGLAFFTIMASLAYLGLAIQVCGLLGSICVNRKRAAAR